MASAGGQRWAHSGWAGVARVLAELKAHPEQEELLTALLSTGLALACRDVASPNTWNTLLQQQVPLKVLTACSDLLPTFPTPAVAAAEELLGAAVQTFTQGPSSTSSSSRTLTATLWGQVEQSGFLQQLPGLLDSGVKALQACSTETGNSNSSPQSEAGRMQSEAGHMSDVLLTTLARLKTLQGSFFTDHAAGQQCILPAMQLSLMIMRHASKALSQSGRQALMQQELVAAWYGVLNAAHAAAALLHASTPARQAGSSSGSGSQQRTVAALLRSEEMMECCCLRALVWMLVSFMQEAPGSSTGGGSSSSTSGPVLPPRSGRAGAGAAGRTASSQPLTESAVGMSGGEWNPAALAPSMPAVYATMLQRLGLSQEVGLWLAKIAQQGAEVATDVPGHVHTGLSLYNVLREAMVQRNLTPHKRLAPLQALLPAVTLQWLISLPAAELLHMGQRCVSVCAQAVLTCRDVQLLYPAHQWTFQDKGATGDLTQLKAAYQDIVVLSAAVLEKLLRMCRTSPSTASSSRSSSPRLSDHYMLLLACEQVVTLLGGGLVVCAQEGVMVRLATAATPGDEGSQGQDSSSSSSLPVTCAQLCKLLQEFLRLEVAAATAATPDSGRSAGDWVVEALTALIPMFVREPFSGSSAWDKGGPLVAPVVDARPASSPDDLQLFGLLCSLLKVYSNPSLLAQSVAVPKCCLIWPELGSAVSAAVFLNIQATLGRSFAGNLASSTNNSDSSSPTDRAAALPWLVLLGRCCLASVVMLQHWQRMLGPVGAPGSSSSFAWSWYRQSFVKSLQDHLLPGIGNAYIWLAGAVQQLSALGYQPQDTAQQLMRVTEALLAANNTLQATVEANPSDVLADIQQPLHAASSLLTCFAIRQACNNPGCANMSGPSEARLVGGHGCTCSGCHIARYCGRDPCQRVHWKQHKPVCRALAAAAAAAAAAGGAAEADAAAESGDGGAAV